MEVIARIHNDFPTKFGLPRQSGLAPSLRSKIVFEPAFRVPEALKDKDDPAPYKKYVRSYYKR